VVYKCKGSLHPDLMAEIFEHGTIEILGIADCDLLWNSILVDGALPKEFLDGCGGDIFDGLHFNPLGEILHCDNNEAVVSLCL
jgi:hypothetical protein